MAVILRVGALIAAVALVGGCSWGDDDGRDRNPANRPGYAWPSGTATASSEPHVVRGPARGAIDAAMFQLVNGCDIVRVSVADLDGELFRMSTPDDAKVAPAVTVDRSTVVAGLRGTGLGGPALVTVLLAEDVRWDVRLGGGATGETVDLTGGRGGDVDFSAGTSRADVALPAARGTQRVTMNGGASELTVRLDGRAPVRVAATGGAGSVTVDGEVHTGVSGNSVWTPDGWDSATDRYDVVASSGVSTMVVERI
jgi:hypothetical protein